MVYATIRLFTLFNSNWFVCVQETSAKKRNTNNSFNGQDEAFDEGRDPPHNSDQVSSENVE